MSECLHDWIEVEYAAIIIESDVDKDKVHKRRICAKCKTIQSYHTVICEWTQPPEFIFDNLRPSMEELIVEHNLNKLSL